MVRCLAICFVDSKTHLDFLELGNTIMKIDVLTYDVLILYKLLEGLTGVQVADIPLNDPKVLELFKGGDTWGLPEFGTPFMTDMLRLTNPKNMDDLLKVSGLAHGTHTWTENAELLIRNSVCSLSDVIACRDDIMLYLIKQGPDRKTAFFHHGVCS